MIDVKRPVLLDANLDPIRVLEPQNVAITLNSPGVSQATITLGPNDPEPAMHAWAEIFNQHGSVGIFRVSVPSQDYTQQQSITLRHGIDSLADSHWIGQEEFSGTVAQLITRLLAYQTARVKGEKPWQLGTCQCTAQKKLSINYDRLSDLLATIEEDESEYYFSYDQSAFPWTINFLQKPAEADGEFRLNRSVRTISRTLNDNDLCTQLILSVNVTVTEGAAGSGITPGDPGYTPTPGQTDADATGITATSTTTETVIRTYNNAEAQAVFGIVQVTADIDTHDDIAGGSFAEADAWAARFLDQHATSTMQLQIDGDELSQLTGDSWDEAQLGHMCRVELPEYGQSFAQRVVSVSYPEALGDPAHVTVSLATQLPKFSSSISSLKKAEAATAKAARGAARGAAKAKELKQWSMVVTDQQLAMDGTGITQLYETGISLDAQGGAKIYSLDQGMQALYSGIEVQAGRIDLVVQGEGNQASIKIQAIVDGINGSQIDINADRIALNGNTSIADVMTINSGGSLLVKRMAIFGDSGNLVTINNGKVSAETVQINSSGSLTFGDGTGYGYRTMDATKFANVVIGFGSVGEEDGQITIPYKTIRLPNGDSSQVINFSIASTQYYQDGVEARTAHSISRIDLDAADIGETSQDVTVFSEDDWEKDLTVTVDASAVYEAGQESVSAIIVDGNDDPQSGQHTLAGGSTMTVYPATYIGGVATRNTSAALVITAADGADSVTLANYDTSEGSYGATTEEIKFLSSSQSGSALNVDVGVRLSNGKQYRRTITGINISAPAPTVNGWDIWGNASGTTVKVVINGEEYKHDFSSYP